MKKLFAIIVLGLLWCNLALAATDIVDAGIGLYGILMFIGGAGVLSATMGPVLGVIVTIIITAIMLSD